MNEPTERKILTALMLLEMCERADDPSILDKLCAAHSFLQSAWSELRGTDEPTAVSPDALEFVAQIHADAAIEGARDKRE